MDDRNETMKAVVQDRYGVPAEVLKLVDLERPAVHRRRGACANAGNKCQRTRLGHGRRGTARPAARLRAEAASAANSRNRHRRHRRGRRSSRDGPETRRRGLRIELGRHGQLRRIHRGIGESPDRQAILAGFPSRRRSRDDRARSTCGHARRGRSTAGPARADQRRCRWAGDHGAADRQAPRCECDRSVRTGPSGSDGIARRGPRRGLHRRRRHEPPWLRRDSRQRAEPPTEDDGKAPAAQGRSIFRTASATKEESSPAFRGRWPPWPWPWASVRRGCGW